MFRRANFDPRALVPQPNEPCAITPAAGNKRPALIDRECDVILPARLFEAWQEAGKPRAIIRALTEAERSKLVARRDELVAGLAPYSAEQRDPVMAAIDAMFAGFRSMRRVGEETTAITAAVLRDYPRWAIEEVCLLIARGEAGLEPGYAPNDAEISAVVERIVYSRRRTLETVTAPLLEAPVARVERKAIPAPEPRRPELPGGDGKHAERVAADLAARKAARGDQA